MTLCYMICKLVSIIFSYIVIAKLLGTSCPGYELSWVRVVLGTSCLGYESSWVRVVLGTSCPGYELSWVRVVLGTSCLGYELSIILHGLACKKTRPCAFMVYTVMWSLMSRTLPFRRKHYIDVIMTTMASQITSLTVVYSTVYSDADQRKHQSSAPLAFVWGIHRGRWIPRTKGQ